MRLRGFLGSSDFKYQQTVRTYPVTLLATLLMLFSSELLAQQQQPTFRTGIDLIEIEVTVLNNQGEPVRNLQTPEFRVTVNDQTRSVVTAEFIDLRTDTPERRPVVADAGGGLYSSNTGTTDGRLIVIMLDRENMSFGSGANVTRAAARFLERLNSNDRVALVTLPQPGPRVDFTANHDIVREAVDGLVGMRMPILGTLNIGLHEALMLINAGRASPTTAALIERFCGNLPPTEYDLCADQVGIESRIMVDEMHRVTDESLRGLESILDALREIEGPKDLLWISEGLVIDGPGTILRPIEQAAAASRTTIHTLMVDQGFTDASINELPPSPLEDRGLEEFGLRQLAAMTRGDILKVGPNADAVFERLETAISGYYLLGIESLPTDRNGEAHEIDVSVLRRGVRVRARREFVIPRTNEEPREEIDEQMLRVLRAPFVVTDLPIRLTSYVFQAEDVGRVRVLVAAEIDAFESSPSEVALGLLLRDLDGNVMASWQQQETLIPVERPQGIVLERVVAFETDPGSYVAKLAVVDGRGRKGSVEHHLLAWQLAGLPFASGDLLLADASVPLPNGLTPPVEAQLTGNRLAVYTELYADEPTTLDEVNVRIEVTETASDKAKITEIGTLEPGAHPKSRILSTVVSVDPLPPGRYVARAVITRNNERLAQLSRPFQIDRPLTPGIGSAATTNSRMPAAASSDVVSRLLGEALLFKHDTLLTPEVINFFMDQLDAGRPALQTITSELRSGNLAGAGRRAFETGDQMAAAFLQGLNLFDQRKWNQAQLQFSAALSLEPNFAPASFYLGACYAAVGRDSEAVTQWRRTLLASKTTSIEHGTLADALFRMRESNQALVFLRKALTIWPKDDALIKKLAIAHALELNYDESLAIIEPYVERHPTDHVALLLALINMFSNHVSDNEPLDDQSLERMRAYAITYATTQGPHLELVRDWMQFVNGQ